MVSTAKSLLHLVFQYSQEYTRYSFFSLIFIDMSNNKYYLFLSKKRTTALL